MTTDEQLLQHLTSGEVSRQSGISLATVLRYADARMLSCVTLNSGMRLFNPDAVEQVKRIYAERMANRGRGVRQQGPAAA